MSAPAAMVAGGRGRARAAPWLPAAALAAAALALLFQAAGTARWAWSLIGYPFGIDYGEGIVWQQMINIVAGRGYAPLGLYPAIVYHYPPLYHVAVALAAWAGGLDGLAAGRLVSWLATLAMAGLVGLLAWLPRPADAPGPRLAAAVLAGFVFLGTDPVMTWCAMMRVDMLAGLFGLAGVAAAVGAVRRPGLVWVAAPLFAAALFTKQVSIAAPIAGWAALLATRPARAWRLAAATVALGLAGLAVMGWLTGWGFLTHILLYNVNRFRPELLGELLDPLRRHGVYLALAGAGAWRLLRAARAPAADAGTRAAGVAALAFLLGKTLLLGLVMKSGANSNYLVEWFAAVAIAVAQALGPAVAVALAGRARPACSPALAAALLAATAVRATELARPAPAADAAAPPARALWRLVELIRHTRRPAISDEMVLLIRAGRPVAWEPAIVAELAAQGRYDEAGFIRLVRARRFGLFLTQGEPGSFIFDSRYPPPLAAAIRAAYPREERIGPYTLHRPPAG